MRRRVAAGGPQARTQHGGSRVAGTAVRIGLVVLVATATIVLLGVGTAVAAAFPVSPSGPARSLPLGTRVLSQAPVNPAFTAYQRLRSMARLRGVSQQGLGLIPSPINFSYLRAARAPLGDTTYPSSYDLRTLGKLSPVEDQGGLDTCWAFASLGSLESCLLPSDPQVFSEDNLCLTAGFDGDPYDGGGNSLMATAYLANWKGPVAACEESYGDYDVPAGLLAEDHIQNVDMLPSRTGALDNDWIKWAVTNYGAVYTGIYADSGLIDSTSSAAYNPATASYYYYGADTPNHAVDIVGWDDNYSAANFSTQPPGNGAFIVRNSWGTGFGQAGYFYVSYYDSQIGFQSDYPPGNDDGVDANAVFDDAQPTGNYSAIYQYDPLGWTDCEGYGSDEGWFLNQFTSQGNAPLAAVSFYAAEPGSSYTIYADSDPGSALIDEGSGSFTAAGYHTVALDPPLALSDGQAFQVAIDLTTPGYDYPIPIETNIAGYTSSVTASGESYTSADGNTWDPLSDGNVCLKAFTAGSADLTPPTTTEAGADSNWHRSSVTVSFSGTDAGSGVAYSEFDVDRAGWQQGTSVTIPAPADHANDGAHTVLYRSVDDAGNVEAPHSCTVRIDTLGPVCAALNVAVKHDKSCRIYFKVHDRLSPQATNVVTITTRSGRVKKRWSRGYGANYSGYWWVSYRCTLPKGTYLIRVYGKDLAGNQQSVAGKAYLHVR